MAVYSDNLKEKIINLFFPPEDICPLCAKRCSGNICVWCEELLEKYWQEDFCQICGRYFAERAKNNPALALSGKICTDCSGSKRHFQFNRGIAPYDSILKDALYQLKYSGRRSLAKVLGLLMADAYKGDRRYWKYQLIVPVPLSQGKLIKRGFNQSQLLAETMAEELFIPAGNSVINRIKETETQAKLNKIERQKNLKNVFQLIVDPKSIQGKNLLVIDDVFTTGSTLDEISRVLVTAGAGSVAGMTLTAGTLTDLPV